MKRREKIEKLDELINLLENNQVSLETLVENMICVYPILFSVGGFLVLATSITSSIYQHATLLYGIVIYFLVMILNYGDRQRKNLKKRIGLLKYAEQRESGILLQCCGEVGN